MSKYKIAVVGPESSGKSVLVKELASHFNGGSVDEFARHYLEDLDRPYNYEDLLAIATKQKELEEKAFSKTRQFLFCDSSLLTMKVWCDDKFGKCHEWIDGHYDKEGFDLYLLCSPDLDWEPDPMREDEMRRDYLFRVYKQHLQKSELRFKVVKGQGSARMNLAVNFVEELTNQQ